MVAFDWCVQNILCMLAFRLLTPVEQRLGALVGEHFVGGSNSVDNPLTRHIQQSTECRSAHHNTKRIISTAATVAYYADSINVTCAHNMNGASAH